MLQKKGNELDNLIVKYRVMAGKDETLQAKVDTLERARNALSSSLGTYASAITCADLATNDEKEEDIKKCTEDLMKMNVVADTHLKGARLCLKEAGGRKYG